MNNGGVSTTPTDQPWNPDLEQWIDVSETETSRKKNCGGFERKLQDGQHTSRI